MLVVGFPAGPWQTNCWVVAPAAGEECVVIDPGHGAEQPLDDVLEQHRLRPVAVLVAIPGGSHHFVVIYGYDDADTSLLLWNPTFGNVHTTFGDFEVEVGGWSNTYLTR